MGKVVNKKSLSDEQIVFLLVSCKFAEAKCGLVELGFGKTLK